MAKFWIWQGPQCYTVFWICQNMSWVSYECIFGSKYGRILTMQELRRVLNMSQCGWISINRTWIYLSMSEFMIIARVLNVHHNNRMRSLQINEYLLGDRCIQNPVKDLRWSTIEILFNCFYKTLSLKFLREFWMCAVF